MLDLDLLIDKAKSEQGLKSDRDLDRHLGNMGSLVSMWRKGKSIPSDEKMVQLANAAKEDVTRYLIELAIHRTASREEIQANEEWRRILNGFLGSLKTTALACMIGLMCLISFEKPASADQGLMEPIWPEDFILWEIIRPVISAFRRLFQRPLKLAPILN